MRLLIFLGLLYLLYRVVKSWLAPQNTTRTTAYRQKTAEIDDVMVKDPFCEVYFPKKDAIRITHAGRELFFCSTRCRDKYLEVESGKQQ